MAAELIINASLPEVRIALIEDGEIKELLIERETDRGVVGNIYKGKVTRVLPGMQAAFVDIGLEKAAFLYVDDVVIHRGPEESGEEQPASEEDMERIAEDAAALADADTEELEIDDEDIVEIDEEDVVEIDDSDTDTAEIESDADESEEETAEGSAEVDDGDNLEGETEENPEGETEENDNTEEDDGAPVNMDSESDDLAPPEGTVPMSASGDSPESGSEGSGSSASSEGEGESSSASEGTAPQSDGDADRDDGGNGRGRYGRGNRGGRGRRGGYGRSRRGRGGGNYSRGGGGRSRRDQNLPETYQQQVNESGEMASDRSNLSEGEESRERSNWRERPRGRHRRNISIRGRRGRDRRMRPKKSSFSRPYRPNMKIENLLEEGQEVLVQVAKAPIAAKGARLTCHVSLPGRHLVCMPTINHVGVSRRIDSDEERRRLRYLVQNNREDNIGFIVRTATSGTDSERWVRADMDYLTKLWREIKEKHDNNPAPALIYEDLNSILRAVRDWVNDDVKKIIVDSRFFYSEMKQFVGHFMPDIADRVELYHGDIPVFDAYGISTELHRALERKIWLKSGGYIVVDQGEALTAIDVNTGRYVGQRNLEDTILKTNLEAVEEIAYQLRLRNVGGIIIIDLIDMEREENRHRVYAALEQEIKKDRTRPTIVQFTKLGLIELTRKRTRDTLIRSVCRTCQSCEGKGYIKSSETVAYEVMREIERIGIERDVKKILVQAHQEVVDILAIEERDSVEQLEKRYRKQIYLQPVMDYHSEQFEVLGERNANARRNPGPRPERSYGRDGGDRDRGDRDRSRGRRGGRDRDRNRGRRPRPDRDRSRDRDRDRDHEQVASNDGPPSSGAPEESGNVAAPGSGPSVTGDETADSIGNTAGAPEAPGLASAPPSSGNVSGNVPGNVPGNVEEEEDRLAYLRAQAAQDAAIAQGTTVSSSGSGRGQGGGGGGGFRNNNRRRKNAKRKPRYRPGR